MFTEFKALQSMLLSNCSELDGSGNWLLIGTSSYRTLGAGNCAFLRYIIYLCACDVGDVEVNRKKTKCILLVTHIRLHPVELSRE